MNEYIDDIKQDMRRMGVVYTYEYKRTYKRMDPKLKAARRKQRHEAWLRQRAYDEAILEAYATRRYAQAHNDQPDASTPADNKK